MFAGVDGGEGEELLLFRCDSNFLLELSSLLLFLRILGGGSNSGLLDLTLALTDFMGDLDTFL